MSGVIVIASGHSSGGFNIGPGQALVVDAGGSASTISASGFGVNVTDSGQASFITVLGGASMQVAGVADATTVGSGGLMQFAGGSASGTTVSNGGTEVVNNGATASATSVGFGGMEVVQGGFTVGTQVAGGGSALLSQGVASNMTVQSSGLVIFAGGAASNLVAQSGAKQWVEYTGNNSGGVVTVSNGVVSGGVTQSVFSGGVEFATDVLAGGSDTVGRSGIAISTVIESGGRQDTFNGAVDSAAQVRGILAVSGGGVSRFTAFVGGRVVVVSGVVVSGALSGGSLGVQANGEADFTQVLSGGTYAIAGLALSDTISAGGVAAVLAGGITSATQIAGGKMFLSGGKAFSASVSGGGAILRVSAGGSAVGAQVSASAAIAVDAGGVASNTVVGENGVLAVSGSAAGVTVQSGGFLRYAGGSITDAVLSSGAIEEVESGATLVGAGFSGGAELDVLSGGVASATTVIDGVVDVFSGGSAVGTSVGSGGAEVVEGESGIVAVSLSATVFSGGRLSTRSDSVINSPTIKIGGGYIGNGLVSGLHLLGGAGAFVKSGGSALATTVEPTAIFSAASDSIVSGIGVEGGAHVFLAGQLEGSAQIDGTADVIGELLAVGGFNGTGTMTVDAGATLTLGANARIADLHVADGGEVQLGGFTLTTDPTTIDAGGALRGAGTVGGAVTNAGLIVVSAGSLDLQGAIGGAGTLEIAAGGTLQLDGAVDSSVTIAFASQGTGILQVASGASVQAQIVGQQAGDSVVKVPCFAAGTRIATPDGDVAVERLHVGDLVCGPWGEAMPVVWLGHRHVDCVRHPRPQDVWPVRLRAGAFRLGVPARDLLLSPDHGVFVAPPGTHPVLIPARLLIDGHSVTQLRRAHVTYWHVELPRHAVLLAEGLPCESFLDTGNRAAFGDADGLVDLHPDFAVRQWSAHACAPQVLGGPALDWARAWLAARRAEAAA